MVAFNFNHVFILKHLDFFRGTEFSSQGPVGTAPSEWLKKFGITDFKSDNLPAAPLTRYALRSLCLDGQHSSLQLYFLIMAWGGQERSAGGMRNARLALTQLDKIEAAINQVRGDGLSRGEAYELFCNAGLVAGLGPSFFTKILYFCSPRPDFFIMDQWTSKSVNLLTGQRIVHLYNSPTRKNTGANYTTFCEVIDQLAVELKISGDEVEQRLMSQGGRNSWAWRAYLRKHYSPL